MSWWQDIQNNFNSLKNTFTIKVQEITGQRISTSTLDEVSSHSKIERKLRTDNPLGWATKQNGYGSCQALATIDQMIRKPGGVQYLMNHVSVKGNGVYDVTLYDKDVRPLTITVDTKEIYNIDGRFGNDPSSVINLETNRTLKQNLEVNAPKLVRIYELAFELAANPKTSTLNQKFQGSSLLKTENIIEIKFAGDASQYSKDHWSELGNKASVMTCGFPKIAEKTSIKGFKLLSRHAYSMSIDPKTEAVTLRNPWDTSVSLTLSKQEFEKLQPAIRMSFSNEFDQFVQTHENTAGKETLSKAAISKKKELLDISDVNLAQDRRIYRQQYNEQYEVNHKDYKERFIDVARPTSNLHDSNPVANLLSVKNALLNLGYLKADTSEKMSDKFDDKTAQALQKFQQKHLGGAHYTTQAMVVDQATLDKLWTELQEANKRRTTIAGSLHSIPNVSSKKEGQSQSF